MALTLIAGLEVESGVLIHSATHHWRISSRPMKATHGKIINMNSLASRAASLTALLQKTANGFQLLKRLVVDPHLSAIALVADRYVEAKGVRQRPL